jgi:hypothetical protein
VRGAIASALVASVIAWSDAIGQAPAFPATDVRVAVTVRGDGLATVREEYRLSAAVSSSWFEYLDVPCAVVGPVAIRAGGLPFDHDVTARGPWVQLGDSTRPFDTRDSLVYVTYDVRLTSRDVGIPIVFPRVSLVHDGEYAIGRLALEVNFASGLGNTVVLPRLVPSDSGTTWTGRMLAIPSIVRVVLARSAAFSVHECSEPRAEETSGRLTRLLFALGGTMGAWVPLYFFWVSLTGRRSRRDEGAS